MGEDTGWLIGIPYWCLFGKSNVHPEKNGGFGGQDGASLSVTQEETFEVLVAMEPSLNWQQHLQVDIH